VERNLHPTPGDGQQVVAGPSPRLTLCFTRRSGWWATPGCLHRPHEV